MINLTRLLESAPVKTLRDLAATMKALVLTAAVATGLAGWLAIKLQIRRSEAVAISVGCLLIIAVGAAAYALGRRAGMRPAFEVLSLSSVHLIERDGDHHRYTWTKEYEIRSRRDGLRLIPSDWFSTAQGTQRVIVESLIPGQTVLTTGSPEQDQAVRRWIYLGRPLAKGETMRAGIRWTFTDDVVPMNRFVVETARVKTRYHKLVLRFPAAEQPRSVEAFRSSAWNLVTQPRPFDERSETVRCTTTVPGMIDFVLERQSPRTGTGVGLRWEYGSVRTD